MQLTIREPLRPFSHVPGTSTILPGTFYQVQVYPCLIRIFDLRQAVPILMKEVWLNNKGPLKSFTVTNELEKGCIKVWGESIDGRIRYTLQRNRLGGVQIIADHVPDAGLSISYAEKTVILKKKESFDLIKQSIFEPYQQPACSRVSFGCHKPADWELVKRRLSLAEILPHWHYLGQLIPPFNNQETYVEGIGALFQQCHQIIQENRPEKTERNLLNLFQAGFKNILVPRSNDDDYQGIIPREMIANNSPLFLLQKGFHLIQNLFIQQTEQTIHILPHLLPSFFCGRLLKVPLKKGGSLSMEWTKKTIRRLIVRSEEEQTLRFLFRSGVKTHRIQCIDQQGKAERVECGAFIHLNKNSFYHFDNFM
jgi:hypothetical protein